MFIDRKTLYGLEVGPFQLDLQIQCNPSQNPNKSFHGSQQTDSKVYMGRQKSQNSQNNIEGKQSWRPDTTQLQDLL